MSPSAATALVVNIISVIGLRRLSEEKWPVDGLCRTKNPEPGTRNRPVATNRHAVHCLASNAASGTSRSIGRLAGCRSTSVPFGS